jgi:cytochrome c oxidase subunit 2
MPPIPFFPEQASTFSAQVDALYSFLIVLSIVFGLGIAVTVTVFAVRYRRRSPDDRPALIHGSLTLELAWSVGPLLIVIGIFLWSATLFFSMERVPPNAMEIYVVGKRWMWKLQHMTGQREINELHVPVGTPVRLTLTSEDVIHSFYVPAFRVKKDAVPGRYSTLWFQPIKTGRYHLFCAEYCGTKHSGMIGTIVVMEPAAFQEWLAGGPSLSPAAEGEKLFSSLACITCHRSDSGARGPRLDGLFGSTVALSGGGTAVADAEYIRESIVTPSAKIVAGYQPIMPTFQGQVTEEQLLQLVEYIRTLSPPPAGSAATASSPGLPSTSAAPLPAEPKKPSAKP